MINPLVYPEGDTLLFRGGEFLGHKIDITLEATAAGLFNGLRVIVIVTAFGLMSAAVDPDELLRMFRRVSYRSALTATLATRLVPGARPRRHPHERRGALPSHPPGRLAVARAALAGALDRAVDVAAALEVRGYSLGGRTPRRRAARGRGTTGASRPPRRIAALRWPARSRGSARSSPIRRSRSRPGRSRWRFSALVLLVALVAVRGTCGAAWGWRMAEPLVVADGFGYRYPEAGSGRRWTTFIEDRARDVHRPRGCVGVREVDAAARLLGLVPHFHGGEATGELRVGGLDVREHGPGELAAVCGTVFQEPETQVVMGGVRAELELPLEHRGEPAGSVARAVEETALGLGVAHLLDRRTDTLSGGELQRVAIAAAMVHDPPLLCSTSRPPSSTPSPATSSSGSSGA